MCLNMCVDMCVDMHAGNLRCVSHGARRLGNAITIQSIKTWDISIKAMTTCSVCRTESAVGKG